MPQGPGDDILDSIEQGTPDDQVMNKFKINADQLKAFKSLHYGLSNQKMNYNEIEDYYPELSSYFKGGAPEQKPAAADLGKLDFTKTAHEPKITESTGRPDQPKIAEQVAVEPKPNKTMYELFGEKTGKAYKAIFHEQRNNDDVIEKMIREGRYNDYKNQKEDQLAKTPASDMPATTSDVDVSRLMQPEVKPQDMPVTPEDIATEKQSIESNENHARLFLRTVAKEKPEKAKELQSAAYYLDAARSMQQDPANIMRINKVMPNVEKIKNGELVYDIKSGHLIKPENPLQSLLSGWQQKSKLFDDFSFFSSAKDEDIIAELEKRRKAYDPDEPTPMPENTIAEITQGVGGMPLKSTITGLGVGMIPGAQEMAPFASAAVGSADFYKMASAGTEQQAYNEFRNNGDDQKTALTKAKDLALKSGLTDAAMGAAMSLIGGRIAAKPLPKLNFSAGYRTAAASILNNAGHAVANNIGEGLLIGGLSGASQMAKNKFAQAAGIDRNIDEGVGESIESNLLLTLGMSAAMKLGQGLNPKTYKTLLNGMSKVEPEALSTAVEDHVKTGEITKEEADNIKSEVADHRAIDQTIPDNITEEARIKIQNKIKKRQEIEDETKQKLESTDKSYHAAIKERAKVRTDKINEDILELSKDKKTKEELQTENAETTNLFSDEQEQDFTKRGFEKNDNGIWVHKSTNPIIKELLNGWMGKLLASNGVLHAGSLNIENVAGSLGKFNFKSGKQPFFDLSFGAHKTEGDYFVTLAHELGHHIYEGLTDKEKEMIEDNKELTESAQAHKDKREAGGTLKNYASDAEESWSDYVIAYLGKLIHGIDGEDFKAIPKDILPILKDKVKIPKDLFESQKQQTNESKTEAQTQAEATGGLLTEQQTGAAAQNVEGNTVPVSDKIQPTADYETLNMGMETGKEETKEARARNKERMLNGNTPMDGEGGTGETGRKFAARVLTAFDELKNNTEHNTVLVTHSSVLKAIKAWESPETWKETEKPGDPANMNDEQWKSFAEAFNKESTDNGDVETFKGDGGDIHVVRHGQTEDNKANKFRSGNTPLTDKGIAQAKEISDVLIEKIGGDIPKIVTSDLPRAIHTSNLIHEYLNTDQNAIPEQSAAGVHVSAPSSDSQTLGQGNEGQGPVAEASAGPQEVSSAQKRFYENAIGATPQAFHLIEVDPIVGGEPKKIREIISDVSKGLKQRLIYSKTPGVGGSYLPSFKGIKIRYNGDLNVTAHELGHSIDDQFGFYNEALKNPAILNELNQFTNQGLASNPPASHPNPAKYMMQEGVAEWCRGFVINPSKAERLAPETTALYRSMVSDKFQKVVKQFSDDFRTWRGSTGRDITLANVEFEPNSKGILAKLFKQEETNNGFSINWVDRLAANFINPLHAFEKAFNYAKGIRGLSDVLPEDDPIILSRILNGIDGKFGEILKTGMIDSKGDVLKDANDNPKNLNWLLEPMDNTDSGSIKRDMKDTIAYMISERVVDNLSKNLQRGEILTGVGGGVMSDFSVAQKTLNEFENGDPARLARIKEAAARYRELADDMLRYAVDKGRMSDDQYNLIKQNNTQYVALQRYIETEPGEELIVYQRPGGKNLGSKGEVAYKLKGSTKSIQNPYTSLLDSLYKTIRESDRNETLRAFRDMLVEPRDMSQGSPKRLSDIGIIGKAGNKQSIPIFIDGKAEHWIFQKDVYEQLKGLDKEAYRLPGLITAPGKALRFFTTHFPTFAVRNWVKDLQDRIIKSTTGSGFKALVGNKEDWNAIARAGGLNSGQYLKSKEHYYGLLTEAMDGLSKDKGIHILDPVRLKHIWHNYEDLLYKGETSNRVAEYRSAFKEAQKKGMDNYNASMYAAFKARDLIDFAVMGHWMKIANQIIPFSNAAIQGLRSAAVSIKSNPLGFAARMAIYSIAPGMAAWYWNHRNDEDGKEYEEMPPYQRDMFWNFKLGANKWLSIPKPYELSLPQAGIDRFLSYHYADNKKAFEGYGKDVMKLLLPFDEGNIAGPYQAIIEGYSNYDFFRDRTIIPPDEDALNLTLRHTETASRLGQVLQTASEKAFGLFGHEGIDARKWDHFLQRQFSYTGSFVMKLSDIGVEKGRHEFDLSDTGLFKRSPAYNSVSVQDMIQYAKGNGLTKSQPYKAFNKKVGEYFNADNDEERERIGKELIEFSKGLLEEWQKKNMSEHQQKRAEAKKAAQKR